jgi:hypothetical protein
MTPASFPWGPLLRSEHPSSPEPTTKLENDLGDWIARSYWVIDGGSHKLPKMFPALFSVKGVKRPYPLGIVDDPKHTGSPVIEAYQGILLSYTTVDDHMDVLFGVYDRQGEPYYFNSNLGDITNPWFVLPVSTGNSDENMTDGKGGVYSYPGAITYLNDHVGQAFGLNLCGGKTPDVADPNGAKIVAEIDAQAAFTQSFDDYNQQADWVSSYRTAPNYQEFMSIVNVLVSPTDFDPTKIPFLDMLGTLWTLTR